MKYIISIFLCCFILCGCTSANEEFFDYQNDEMSFQCAIVYNGHENEVKITMSAPDENGERETVRVEYISPEIISGYTLEKSGGEYKGKMGEIEIPFGENAAGVVKDLESIFSLTEDMISSIETAENGMTEAAFVCEEISGKVIMNDIGELSSIEANFDHGDSLSLKVKE